ncbi:MAG: hypothetical protein ACXV47_05485, partial [Halobacteriota archaeon]
TSADEATSAAGILCTMYAERKGNVPGDLIACYLTNLRAAPPFVAAAFFDYISSTCPRLMSLFART